MTGQPASWKNFLEETPAEGKTCVDGWIWPHVVTAWHGGRLKTRHRAGLNTVSPASAPASARWAARAGAGNRQRFVYVLRSESDPTRHHVGVTSDVENRLEWHNIGPDGRTRMHRPWRLPVSMGFADESVARRFERYLKSGSGRAFAKQHFDPEAS